jgi:hypothetical protein
MIVSRYLLYYITILPKTRQRLTLVAAEVTRGSARRFEKVAAGSELRPEIENIDFGKSNLRFSQKSRESSREILL